MTVGDTTISIHLKCLFLKLEFSVDANILRISKMFTFFNISSFPKDPERRHFWIRNVKRDKWRPTAASVLCSKHFTSEDFQPFALHQQRNDLKRTAVPTVFDYPEHLKPKKTKLRKPPRDRVAEEQLREAERKKEAEREAERQAEAQKLSEVIAIEHNYSKPTPEALLERLDEAQAEVQRLKKKLAAQRKKTSFQKRRHQDLSSTLKSLKEKGLLESQGSEHLKNLLTPTLEAIFSRLHKAPPNTRRKVPPEVRVFASTLQFYSSKAYEYVRKIFKNVLPHSSTMRKWFSNIDGSPGFSKVALELLQQKATEGQKVNKPVLVSLILDEMSLRRQIYYDSKTSSYTGYVDIGEGVSSEDPKPATDALVFMAVGVNWHFKVPIGYFFVAGNGHIAILQNNVDSTRSYKTRGIEEIWSYNL